MKNSIQVSFNQKKLVKAVNEAVPHLNLDSNKIVELSKKLFTSERIFAVLNSTTNESEFYQKLTAQLLWVL